MANSNVPLSLCVLGGIVAIAAAFVALRGHAEPWAYIKTSAQGVVQNMQKGVTSSSHQAQQSQVESASACPASQSDQPQKIIVIGGGLAGCTAALTAAAQIQASASTAPTAEVVLVDKMPKLGGNSAKASSGINALNEPGGDSQGLFETDTVSSGGGLSKPDLVSTLVGDSVAAIAFLEGYGVDLSKVTLLGGHSKPRSRTNPVGGNVGWSIMSKIIAAVNQNPSIKVLGGQKLEQLIVDPETGAVCGVKLSSEGTVTEIPAQAVILATGGFAANPTLLARHSPEAAGLATTNGPWAQGDALSVAEAAGAHLRDLDQVQVHPTGFIDPADESSGTKFLAPEKLRGVGGILVGRDGKRFVDELGRRDVVSAAVASQPGHECYLILSEEGAEDYGLSAIQFYATKKLMTKVTGAAELAQHMGAAEGAVQETLETYNAARKGVGADTFGKTVFPKGFPLDGVMYVARITPVVHYTMGGVEIDTQARVLNEQGHPISGLYAAGEVSAGVHGRNRLGGNSLLECTVFGRIAGRQAAELVTGRTEAKL